VHPPAQASSITRAGTSRVPGIPIRLRGPDDAFSGRPVDGPTWASFSPHATCSPTRRASCPTNTRPHARPKRLANATHAQRVNLAALWRTAGPALPATPEASPSPRTPPTTNPVTFGPRLAPSWSAFQAVVRQRAHPSNRQSAVTVPAGGGNHPGSRHPWQKDRAPTIQTRPWSINTPRRPPPTQVLDPSRTVPGVLRPEPARWPIYGATFRRPALTCQLPPGRAAGSATPYPVGTPTPPDTVTR